MNDVTIRFDQKALAQLLESPEGPVGKELMRRATRVRNTALRLAPVDTGRLRASIFHEIMRDAQGLVAIIGSNVNYAPYVELGTSRMGAKPYLRPALAAEVGQ